MSSTSAVLPVPGLPVLASTGGLLIASTRTELINGTVKSNGTEMIGVFARAVVLPVCSAVRNLWSWAGESRCLRSCLVTVVPFGNVA